MAYAYSPKGPLFARMGQVLSARDDPFGGDDRRGQRLWLLPEEVLYLLERGTVDVRWPVATADGEGDDGGLPMSLQAGYAMFIGANEDGLTFERYSVYAALKRQGYTVLRAPSWNGAGPPRGVETDPPPAPATGFSGFFMFSLGLLHARNLWQNLFWPNRSRPTEPLLQPSLYRSYPEIYRRLALIPSPPISPNPTSTNADPHPPFNLTYHAYRPGNPTYKKSSPGTPDFRISVLNARSTAMPTLSQLATLLESTPLDPPKGDAQLYAKLKWGWRNVVLAVVDQGVTSYLRVSEAGFADEKVFERGVGGRGGKGGGRGGRGRGRGRGR